MRLFPSALLLLVACGDDGPAREGFEVRGCTRDEIRLLAFDETDACAIEDPRVPSPPQAADAPIDDVIWSNPTDTSAPALRVLREAPVWVVAHCLDDGGIVREWGCDGDTDGLLSLELEPVCVPVDCDGCQPCPVGSRSWKGGEGEACVADCDACDADRDGHLAISCGGDDCDDRDAGIHPGAPDPVDRDGEWTIERPPELVGDDVSLALDPDGVVHISVHGTVQPGGVLVGRRELGVWSRETAETAAGRGLHTTLAIDPEGRSHLAYYGAPGAEAQLWYASDATGSWRSEPIGPATLDPALSRASIAIDAAGIHVAYHDAAARQLRFSSRVGPGQWETVTVDATQDSGGFASLVLEGGRAHVAYVRAAGGDVDLYYAVRPRVGVPFAAPELVDGEDSAGDFVTIRATLDGTLVLAYRNRTRLALLAASRPAGDPLPFTTVTVEDDGAPGAFAALALDAEGRAHVSHFDTTTSDLRYTMFDREGTVASEAVPFAGDLPGIQSSAIAVGPDGTVHAIWSGRPGPPIYARRTKGAAIDQDCSGADGTESGE
jgi:hypothetical protein